MAVAGREMGEETRSVTSEQRRAHLTIWIVLAPLLLVMVVLATRVMEAPPLASINDAAGSAEASQGRP